MCTQARVGLGTGITRISVANAKHMALQSVVLEYVAKLFRMLFIDDSEPVSIGSPCVGTDFSQVVRSLIGDSDTKLT